MKQTGFYSSLNLIRLALLFAVSSCAPLNDASPVSSSYVAVPLTSTFVPTETPTSYSLPISTPIPTLAVATSLPKATLTITPTLSANEVEVLVQDLLQDDAGCQLPCWWGVTPGQTAWKEAELLLNRIAIKVDYYTLSSNLDGYGVLVNLPQGTNFENHIGPFYTVRDGIVETIELALGNLPNSSLPHLLSLYGAPTEIWLNTYNRSRENSLPFRLLLFYQEQGFLVEYYDEAEAMGEQVRGCFVYTEPQKHPFIFLWDPQKKLSFREGLEMSGLFDEDQFYLSLTEATNIDIITFYEAFKDPTNAACLETPSRLWPAPG